MENITKLLLPLDESLSLPPVSKPYLDFIWIEEEDILLPKGLQNGASFPNAVSPVYYSEVKSVRKLTAGENIKTVLDIEILVKEHKVNFFPGDTIGIIPENSSHDVSRILERIGLLEKRNDLIKLIVKGEINKKKARIPDYIKHFSTPEEILRTCVEIQAVPKKGFLHALSECTGDSKEKRKICELCSKECSAEYNKFFLEQGFTLLDVLEAFVSCKPTLSLLVEHLPRLQGRPYSIASSPLENSESLHVVLSVINKTRGRKGVCSGWLESLSHRFLNLTSMLESLTLNTKEAIKIPVYFRKPTKFRVPECKTSAIMIGPGTGVAPFIGFLKHQMIQCKTICHHGKNKLIFGCRYANRDFIFKQEMESFLQNGILSKLLTCFSREVSNENSPKYVQDLITQFKDEIVNDILNNNFYLYLCGEGTKMMKDVESTLRDCIQEVKGITKKEAEVILKTLESEGKFLKDNWN